MARAIASLIALLVTAGAASAQQVPDRDYRPPVTAPAYADGDGPVVCVDEGHRNFHTIDHRFWAFAELLRRDGFVVRANPGPFSAQALEDCRILVVANADAPPASGSARPTVAFDIGEISAVRRWVEGGGSLLLIADHRPYGGAAAPLAMAFGVRFTDGFAVDGYSPDTRQVARPGPTLFRASDGTLRPHAIVNGRNQAEAIATVRTFTGQAFLGAEALQPLLAFPRGYVLLPDRPAQLPDRVAGMPIDRWLQGGVMTSGQGRAGFFGEAAMFSAQVAGPDRTPMGMNAPGAEQNFQFVLNVLHWLAGLLD